MKDAHSAESNEESIFQFLFFELWLIIFTNYQKFTDQIKMLNLQERWGLLWKWFLVHEAFLDEFQFRGMVDFDACDLKNDHKWKIY